MCCHREGSVEGRLVAEGLEYGLELCGELRIVCDNIVGSGYDDYGYGGDATQDAFRVNIFQAFHKRL